MYVSGQNQQALNIISSLGVNWNMFLMSGAVPETLETMPFQLSNLDSVFDNAVQGLRVKAVNSAGYGQELLVFEQQGILFSSKEHGLRSVNGIAGIQCLPQSIRSDIVGLDKCKGYVNGIEDNTQSAYGSDMVADGKYIEYDLGSPCSISNISYGNSSVPSRNPTSLTVEYFDTETSSWLAASPVTSVKNYVAAGVSITITPVVAQRWRVKFTGNPTALFEYRFLRYTANVLPENVMSKATTDFTWVILVPALPTESVYESVNATQVPVICLEAGGPLDQKPVVLSRKRAGVDDIVASIHCKIFQTVSQEIEVIV